MQPSPLNQADKNLSRANQHEKARLTMSGFENTGFESNDLDGLLDFDDINAAAMTEGTETETDNTQEAEIDTLIEEELNGKAEAEEQQEKTEEAATTAETETNAAEDAKTAEADPETTEAETPQPAPQTFKLKHLDNTVEVSEAEVVTLAQKGMDYDRVRGKYETATAELTEFNEWLKGVTGGQDIKAFKEGIEARNLAEKEGIDQNTALAKVRLENERKALEAEKARIESEKQTANDETAIKEKREKDIANFIAAYPEVAAKLGKDPNAIPAEVWAQVDKGETLTAAYGVYAAKKAAADKEAEIARLKAELEAAKQKQKNEQRSTGSQATDGGAPPYDPIAAGWNSV